MAMSRSKDTARGRTCNFAARRRFAHDADAIRRRVQRMQWWRPRGVCERHQAPGTTSSCSWVLAWTHRATADGRINLAWESSPGALLMLALAGSEASPYSVVQDCSLSCWRDAKPSSKTAPEKPEHQEDPEDPASFKSADIAPRA
ncbi:hypothetical protein E4U27_003051 [Claviceps purpurea]|nr:hypothetical protein E4U27_003051 [Claviceps purpurea]